MIIKLTVLQLQAGMLVKLMLLQLQVSIAVILILALRQGIKKLPKIYSYILWILVFARLLFPVALETRISLMPSAEQSSVWIEQALSDKAGEKKDPVYTDYPDIEPSSENLEGNLLSTSPDWQTENTESNDFFWLWVIWLLGAICILVYNNIILHCLKRKIKNAQPTEQHNVFLTDEISAPFTLGMFSPKIYLPKSLKATERTYVLCHENVHISRKDYLIKNIAFLLLAINWYNPFVWITFHFLESDMEMSCDEKVVKLMGTHIKQQYSQSLLDIAAGSRQIAATPLTFGANSVKHRIKNVLSCENTKSKRKWIRNAAAGTIVLLLIGIVLFTTQTNDTDQNPNDSGLINDLVQNPNLSGTDENEGNEEENPDDTYYNSLLTEYYNTPEGKTKLEADFKHFTESHIDKEPSLNIFVWSDDVLVVIMKFEEGTNLTEGYEEILQQRLDSHLPDIIILAYLYNTEIIGPASVREIIVQYTDSDDNVLAELTYSGQ